MKKLRIIGVVFVLITIGIGIVYAQSNEPERNIRWEYHSELISGTGVTTGLSDMNAGSLQSIKRLGEQGWELVTTAGYASQILIFKRKLP